jgi:hypothetical protein
VIQGEESRVGRWASLAAGIVVSFQGLSVDLNMMTRGASHLLARVASAHRMLPLVMLRSHARAFSSPGPHDHVIGSAPSPVPLADGEILLCNGGASTLRTYMANWVAAFFFSANLGVMASIDALVPVASLSPMLKAGVVGVAGLAVFSARATSRCLVRAAVLEADGAHLRVYTYGAFFRPGKPISIPVRLLKESSSPRAASDTEVLYVNIKSGIKGNLSSAYLGFDKPYRECSILPRVAGNGLAWTDKGLAPHTIPVSAGESASARELSDVAAFRNYALLVWILQGNVVVDVKRLLEGDWDLENMTAQLSARGAVGAEARAAAQRVALATWRECTDDKGRKYFYDELTWETSWHSPGSCVK